MAHAAHTLTIPPRHDTLTYLQDIQGNSSRNHTLHHLDKRHGLHRKTILPSTNLFDDKENFTAQPASPSHDKPSPPAVRALLPQSPPACHLQQQDAEIPDISHVFRTPSVPLPCHLAPDSDEFLDMVDRGLCIGRNEIPMPDACAASHIRSASSEYPSPGHNTPRVQSPVSEYCRGNRLSFSGLSRFGRTNDCLSNLRSSSPSSNQQAIGDTSNQELMADTAAAITEWQGISRPTKSATYNNYSLADSSDLFPSDSLSQRETFSLAPSSPPSQPSARAPAHDPQDFKPLDSQYDGAVDADRNRSPEPKDGLTPALDATQTFHPSKRKASQFSLRSLTRSLSKRPRLKAIRQWAANVYHGSSRRLSEAYHRLKYQRKAHFGEFGAWKGIGRRRRQPADDVKGQSDQPYGAFEYEGGPQGNQEWWKDGVTRYRAPSWMFRAT